MDLALLFPAFVRTSLVEVGRAPPPLPEEASLVAGAVERRHRTFSAGREAARRALRAAGGPAAAILRSHDGAPLWPPGFSGSIAHTDRLAAAAVARASDAAAIGLDIEILAKVRADLAPLILTEAESAAWTARPAGCRAVELALVFSAKEAAIKCLSCAERPPRGLRELTVGLDAAGGTFRVGSVRGGPVLDGRHLVDPASGHVAAGIVRVAPAR